ncbi:DUF1616 domain-containing protein [Halosimplex salinum]|uniref:DUF1616 domain-containing protein n=1 Tax=Halosimplex salinum TaxID=1710538 RepID=UPI000F46ECE2|nr:DUF1616 domain-containing protein [Halosimplex salinum]
MSFETDTGRRSLVDLAVVVALVVAFDVVVALAVDLPALRLALGLPVLLLAPGYAVVAALYPRGTARADPSRPRAASTPSRGAPVDTISTPVRYGLSVVASVAVVAGVALAINFSPWGIRAVPLLVGITAVTVVAAAVAGYRRLAVPAHLRYSPSVPWRAVAGAARPRLSVTFFLGVVFVASAVGATAVLATSDTVANGPGEQYTEFAALTDNGSGEYVTGNYVDTVDAGGSLYFELANSEGERRDYTVVLVRETVTREDGALVVQDAVERDRLRTTLADGATERLEYEPDPSDGEDAERLRVYLYRGDAPSVPSEDSAYRSLQVWYDDPPTEPDEDEAGE